MSNLAAILVLVVCPAQSGHCVSEPLRVVTYESMNQCQQERPREIKYAEGMGLDVFGNCSPFDARLLKDRKPINIVAGVDLNTNLPVEANRKTAKLGFSE